MGSNAGIRVLGEVTSDGALSPSASDHLRDVVEALTEGFAVFDRDGRLVAFNSNFHSLHPSCSDLIVPGSDWTAMLREAEKRGDLPRAVAQRMRAAKARLGPDDAPEVFEFGEPGGRYLAASLSPCSQGGLVLMMRDITAQRQLEADEREADLLLRRVLLACPASVVMCRLGDGHVIYRSPQATELLGTARGAGDYFASRIERADFLTAILPDGRVEAFECTCLRPDGTAFPAAISARLIDYRGEDVMVASIIDLSHEKAMQAELAHQREQIFQAEKMSALGELLAGVAHELNNPLSIVVGHTLMMQEEATEPEALRRIEKIGEAAERCARIVKSFLAMARQQPVRLQPMVLADAVEHAVEALRQASAGKDLRVETLLAADLPTVQGDAHQIGQVILNLLTNAEQAIRSSGTGGRIVLTTRHDASSDSVILTVADDGPGIPEAIRGRIFDPLFTTKEAGKGTGIGLAFCHRVLSAHSGKISFEPGNPGARFHVTLPVARAAQDDGDADEMTCGATVHARLLVVDDEPDVADLIREILSREGFAVDTAPTAEAALSLVQSHPYALILTDLNMPGIGGRGFYETLLRDLPRLVPRIGFITGDTMSPQARTFLEATQRPFLEKPIAPSELRRLARDMIQDLRARGNAT